MELFDLLLYKSVAGDSGGGGGGEISTQSLNVSANGTYRAPTGKAYTPVNVNVPNSYSAADEGKVVDNGALVSQTAHAEVTQNGTIDTTLNNSVTVNVPQGSTPTGTKQISISQNGTTTENVTDYASAEITVAVPVPTLTTLTATDNGTYTPTSGTAYNSVVVAIPLAESNSFGGD